MTVRQATAEISNLGYFSAAKWAMAHILGTDAGSLVVAMDREMSKEETAEYEKLLSRLKRDEPMQYVLGSWQFIDLDIKTDRRALIPRPETEMLAMMAAEVAKDFASPIVYDLGCGTGCIGLYVKSRVPEAKVYLCDISDDALSLAKENAETLKLDCTTVKFDMLCGSVLSCDILLSNPPYIPSKDISGLDANVKDYEPISALNGGDDGLVFYRALAKIADGALSKNGVGMFEIGINQSEDVRGIFSKYFNKVEVIKDYNGIDRIIKIKRG